MIADTPIARAQEYSRKAAKFPGLCLQFVRLCLGIAAKYPSAIAAWRAIPGKYKHSGIAPKGFPMFYNIGQFGHIVLSDGTGDVWSNITADMGFIRKVAYKYFGNYLGWAEQLNGVLIKYDEPPAPPKPKPKPPKWRGAKYPGKIIKRGSRGDHIKELQFHLGFGTKPSGVVDSKTVAAIDRFVLANNKKHKRGQRGYLGAADHTAGPKTFKAITGHA